MKQVWFDERRTLVLVNTWRPRIIYAVYEDGTEIELHYNQQIGEKEAAYRAEHPLPLQKRMSARIGEELLPVFFRGIVRDPLFDETFAAVDAELGAVVRSGTTTFRVWTPSAERVSLIVDGKKKKMEEQPHGVWELIVPTDCTGLPYVYEVAIHGRREEVPDPYAKAVTANSMESVVVVPGIRAEKERPGLANLQDSIIYELHVRDATIHPESGASARGKYMGLTERGTTTSNGFSTGLDYLEELGITHVELLPINDFARVDDNHPESSYNWGYDPLFFQVPEGSYATRPADPENRLDEVGSMIDAFHGARIGVILDVVFNHVFIMEESPFEKLVPGYYFRRTESGDLSNGTGVGNDTATERLMVRKFFVETIDYWLRTFRVDGFRFDLMGALDVETMQQIQARCQEEEVPVMLLGEGWDLPTALAPEQKTVNTRAGEVPGIRFFNDLFRDTMKGSVFDFLDHGFVNGQGRYRERMPQLVKGSASLNEAADPHVNEVNQTVNYVECHDNHTLWDRLEESNRLESESERRSLHQLASALTLVSQGVPFLHAGQEFYRTKDGEGNSYMSPDWINQLDWTRREQFDDDVKVIRALIRIRKEYPAFRLRSAEMVEERLHILETPQPVFGFSLLEAGEDIVIYANPSSKMMEVQLPSTGSWEVLLSTGEKTEASLIGEFLTLRPREFTIAKKWRR
ncbi:type I pullulanase [Alkalicoccus chagannorensis]|uniref:type I pullulanase n=1 Tax=Alkalicoccus chagannorensis TaxID=427072 RepID=UPI000404A91B|nr:type I pullulanase [Alkalicoccus chagannorensis]